MLEESRPHVSHRIIFLAACMAMFVFAASGQALSAALATLSQEFNRNLAQRGLLLAFAPVGFVLSTLVSGWLSDRWGQRGFILAGIVLLCTGLAMTTLAGTWDLLCVGFFLIGVSGGFVESPVSVVISDVFVERRAQALNASQMFFNLGAVIGPMFVGGALWAGWGWRPGFGAIIPIVLATLILSYRGLPKRGVSTQTAESHAPVKPGCRATVAMASVALFLYVGAEMTVASWGPNYMESVFEVSSSRAALVASGFWFSMMLGRALYVVMVNRFGYLKLILWSAALSGTAIIGAAIMPSALVAACLCCVVGFFLGGTWPSILGYVAHRNPGRIGAAFGVIVSAGALGMVIVPPLAGLVAEHSVYGLRAGILVGAASVFAEALIILALWLRDARERSS